MSFDTFGYEYYCPHCGEGFLGEISYDKDSETKEVICEDCNGKYLLKVKFVSHVSITTEVV